MARLYLDNDIPLPAAIALQSRGHDVVHVHDFGTFAESDDYHLSAATRLHRVLVTCNHKDFRLLHHAWTRWTAEWNVDHQHGGILVVPQGGIDVAAIVDDFFRTGYPLTNHLYRYVRSSGWAELR